MKKEIKKNKKALRITLISLLAFLIVFSIVSMIVVKSMYDKQFPKTTAAEYYAYLSYEDVESSYPRTLVQFESGENTLQGYIYGETNNKGLVVIAHGLGGGAISYLPETLYFVDHGWRVFIYDCTGSYASEGKSTKGLPQSVLDLNAALGYVKSNNSFDNLPIMLFGHSWGGYAVTAILNFDYDITAVASVAGYNSPMGILLEQAKGMLGFFAYMEYPYEWAYQTMLFGKDAKINAVDGINKSQNTAVMIIHGDNDKTINYDGASIISHREEILNPNVIYKTCSTENHNGHSDLLKSEASRLYVEQKNKEYKEIYDNYNGDIPKELKDQFYSNIDKFKTSELDADFMNDINNFFESKLG